MARKAAAAPKPAAKKSAAKKSAAKAAPKAESQAAPKAFAPKFAGFPPAGMPNMGEMAKMAKLMTPEQAIDLYKTNTKLALDVINAALEGTAKMRRLQFEGEEAGAGDGQEGRADGGGGGHPQCADGRQPDRVAGGRRKRDALLGADVRTGRRSAEAPVHADGGSMSGVPGVKEAKAAMAMMPDLRQAQNVVDALQGVVSSGGNAFESMQKVMGDFAKFMPGAKR